MNQSTSSTLSLGAGVTDLTIEDCQISVAGNQGGGSKPLFDTAANYTIKGGRIRLPNTDDWSAPAAASGILDLNGVCTYT